MSHKLVQPVTPQHEHLKVGALAARYGLSEWTIRRWIKAGMLPYSQPAGVPGGHILIDTRDMDRFLAASRTDATTGPLAGQR